MKQFVAKWNTSAWNSIPATMTTIIGAARAVQDPAQRLLYQQP